MTKSFERASDAVDNLLEIYQGRLNVVNGAKEVWEKDQEQADRMQELETTIKCLIRTQSADAEGHKKELAALEEKVKAEKAAKGEVESRYKQDYQGREAQLNKREDELKKIQERAEKQLLLKERKMQKNIEDSVDKLREKNADLRNRNQELEAQLSQSQLSCEKTDRAYVDLSKERKSLELRVIQMQQDTEIAEREDTYL
jgi:chromosome segregation ATPase